MHKQGVKRGKHIPSWMAGYVESSVRLGMVVDRISMRCDGICFDWDERWWGCWIRGWRSAGTGRGRCMERRGCMEVRGGWGGVEEVVLWWWGVPGGGPATETNLACA